MDHYAVKDAGDLQSTSSFVEPLLSNRQSNPLSYPEYKSHQLFGASSAVRCDDVCKIQVHAKLSTEIPFNTKDYLRITSSDDDKPADETMKSQKYHCPPQILGCAEAEQSSSHESSFATNAITENASAVLEITHRTDGLTCDLISKRGGVGVVQGNYSYDSVSEEVTGFEEPTSVEQDACNAEAKTGDINEDADSLKKSLIAKQGEQKKVGAEQSDICNDKDLKLIGEIRVETRLKSGLNYCVGPDDDADGVLVLGPCEEQRRWPHSRPISIERRPEGFGFTLRNVVAYPSHIHKIATSLGKRPKDIEPWWVEGKPLDAVVVREVRECGAAQAAGLRPHDRIVAHRGSPIESYAKFVAHIHQCSSVLELVVVSVLDDPLLRSGLLAAGAGGGICAVPSGGLSRSVISCPAPSLGSMDTTGGTGLASAGIGAGFNVIPVQRSHWLSSSLAPRPYLSSYPRGKTLASIGSYFYREEQQRELKSLQLVHSSPINQSTVSLNESVTTSGSISGAESELSLSLPAIPLTTSTPLPSSSSSKTSSCAGPMPPSVSVPSHLATGKDENNWRILPERGPLPNRRGQKNKKIKAKKDKRLSTEMAAARRGEGSRSSSLGSLDSPSPGLQVSVAAKLQLFEGGGQGFLARSMEKLKLYRSELTRMTSPPPNTVQTRTAQFEKSVIVSARGADETIHHTCSRRINKKVSVHEDTRANWQSSTVKDEKIGTGGDKKSGTTSPPPGVSLKKLKTLFADKSSMSHGGTSCALKILRFPENGKRFDHSWRPAGVHVEKRGNGNSILRIVTDKESINVVVNKLLCDLASGSVRVSLASATLAKRRKNVLHFIVGRTVFPSTKSEYPLKECSFCSQDGKLLASRASSDAEYEFLVQCDTSATMNSICSVIHAENNDASGVLHVGPSVIERAAAFDRRFLKNHQPSCATSSWAHSGSSTQQQTTGMLRKPPEVTATQRSKSRRASMGDEPNILLDGREVEGAVMHKGDHKGSSIGVPLDHCPPSVDNPLVPWLVVHCCSIIEKRGLDVLGIYRVPGNSAAVQHLMATVNNQSLTKEKGGTSVPINVKLDDPRWADVNVVSSLLKSFFRLLPEPLLTGTLYHHFIAADKIPDCGHRLAVLHSLVHKLPPIHMGTLRFFCSHLQRVAARAETNKMDSRNLSIVLGPTLVRSGSGIGVAQSSMLSMISDMRHQCHLTETFVNYGDYLFTEDPTSTPTLPALVDTRPLLSSSPANSISIMDNGTSLYKSGSPLSTKLSLLPGTPAPILSVKQKIHSFECGKPPVLEETALSTTLTKSCMLSKIEESAYTSPSSSVTIETAIPSKLATQYKRQVHKDRHRQRSGVGHELGQTDPIESPRTCEAYNNPMCLSYHERSVLAAEKAKIFEEETRAVLEKKAFRSQVIVSGTGNWIQEQRMSREQTERIWQEVKRQATLLTRDNSDDNIDKENQNMVDSVSGFYPVTPSGAVPISVSSTGGHVPNGERCDSAEEETVPVDGNNDAEERLIIGKSLLATGISSKGDGEMVVLRARSGRNLGQQQHANRSNRNGVVYSPNSSKILKSIVQLDDQGNRSGTENGGARRKKSRLERRHTIAGSHSYFPLMGSGPMLSGTMMNLGDTKTHLSRPSSERKPRPPRHRATT